MNKKSLLRITQMNAIYLDEEIYKSLRQILEEASRNLPVRKKRIKFLDINFYIF